MTRKTRLIWIFQIVRVFLCVLLAQPAAAQCRLALVLALDVSGSVNEAEYAQQVNGLANALNDPDVRALLLWNADAPVALTVFEWSSRNHQYVIQPWVSLDSPAAIDAAIVRIRSHRKVRAGLKTALGTALLFAANMLNEQPECWQHTIDVSGDGRNNIGISPGEAYATGQFENTVVNALVVHIETVVSGAAIVDTPDVLRRYFEQDVIRGPNAFAMVAEGYADYADAMRRKLMRELALPTLGQIDF